MNILLALVIQASNYCADRGLYYVGIDATKHDVIYLCKQPITGASYRYVWRNLIDDLNKDLAKKKKACKCGAKK